MAHVTQERKKGLKEKIFKENKRRDHPAAPEKTNYVCVNREIGLSGVDYGETRFFF